MRVSPEVARSSGVVPVDGVVEVDGTLDAVSSHDLRRLIESLYTGGARHVRLDLSRVTHADVDGIAGLAWCSAHAVGHDRVLTWSRVSTAVLVALHQHPRQTAVAS